MSRGRALGLGAAGLLLGGVVLAAGGILPNPFDKPPTADGRAPGWQDPFHIPDDRTKPATPEGTTPGWQDPFHIADDRTKPAAPEGTTRGWQDPFHIPEDLTKPGHGEGVPGWQDPFQQPHSLGRVGPVPADAGPLDPANSEGRAPARGHAAFDAGSRFPPNPEDDSGLFRFDLAITQQVHSQLAQGYFTHYANTRDGSLLFGPELAKLMVEPRKIPHTEVDFVIRKANGDLLACGRHRDVGQACLKLGAELPLARVLAGDQAMLDAFLHSIASTPQRMDASPDPRLQAVRGYVLEGGQPRHLQLWIDPAPSAVRSSVPWLGAGAGLFRDGQRRQVRVARRVLYEKADLGGSNVVVDLVGYVAADESRDTRGYRQVTAFTAAGNEQAIDLGTWLWATGEDEAEIASQLLHCPEGSKGRPCREALRAQLRSLQEARHQTVMDYARQHGLPLPPGER